MKNFYVVFAVICSSSVFAQNADSTWFMENYYKVERLIPMRDSIKLFTSIYIPKDNTEQHPILVTRTPYSIAPYGENEYPKLWQNFHLKFLKEKYIIVRQDVRGRFMSEGEFEHVRPFNPNKKTSKDVDEASDSYDTIEWLLKNVPNNNGRVGIIGVSYPGFYATAAALSRHPALKAVSPQGPVTDWFIGDDFHHNGALMLMDAFSFPFDFGETAGPTKDYGKGIFSIPITDLYRFFLQLGPLKNTQSSKYYNNKSRHWNAFMKHPNYDTFWKKMNIRPYLSNVTVPTLVVGGWFDAENLFGALRTYEAIEKQNQQNENRLVMGPWGHGSWHQKDWRGFGTYIFGDNVNKYFLDSLEFLFFNNYLKGQGSFNAAEATVFETGSNQWRHYSTWPPANISYKKAFLADGEKLLFQVSNNSSKSSYSEYFSDPRKPVPYTNGSFARRNDEYMVEDQRFASKRPDVIYFETEPLEEDLTLAGKIVADLFVAITGTDADFIVKLIDVFPDNEKSPGGLPPGFRFAGMQQLVRAEVMRGKFRNSFEKPEPFVPNKVTQVKFNLNDVAHTFKKGHRIMVQVQSSWFPLVDRNPQKFVNIYSADVKDFQKAEVRIYHSSQYPSNILLPVLSKLQLSEIDSR